jgi:hypothetical protein
MNQTSKLRLILLFALLLLSPVAAVHGQGIAPQTLFQQAKLSTAAGTSATAFGTRVSASGTFVLVSNQGENNSQGAAYVFARSGGNWVQQARLVDPSPVNGDQFGYGAIDGNYAAIGATRFSSERGKLTFWKRNFIWQYQTALTASDAVAGDRFGFINAMSGATVVSGVPRKNNSAGAAYVFIRTNDVWTEQAKIAPADLTAGNEFGTDVAVDGDTIAISAPNQFIPETPTELAGYGAVYIFTRTGTTWTQQAKLFVRGLLDPETDFGRSIGLSGDRLIVSTDFNATAYIYKRTGTTWILEQQLLPLIDFNEGFGYPVGIRGQRAVVGDRNCGCLTVHTLSGSTWTQQQQLKPSETVTSNFPSIASMSSTTSYVVASNQGTPDEPPQVFVFDPLTAGARHDSIGIYRGGVFYLRYTNSTGSHDLAATFGGDPSDLPIAGDWNGDGIDTIGIYRSNAGLYLLSDSNQFPAVNYNFTFGNPGDAPLAGRWSLTMVRDGTGVYRNSNGILYLREALSTGFSDYDMVLGNPGDRGIAGDWNGNTVDTVGIYRPSEIKFYLSNVNGNGITFADVVLDFGTSANDIPVAGNWAGYNITGVGVFTTEGKFKLKIDPNVAGSLDLDISYGAGGDRPVIGRWIAPSAPPPMGNQNPLNGIVVQTGANAPSQSNADSGGAD